MTYFSSSKKSIDEEKNEATLMLSKMHEEYLVSMASAISDSDDRIKEVVDECKDYKNDDDETIENVAMNVIERIVSISDGQDRQGAITEAAKELIVLMQTNSPEDLMNIYKRVLHEFIICTDEEYEMLRKQIFEK